MPIQPTAWNELSTYPRASSLPFSGQKARDSNVARDASFPELGRLYFTRRKFLLGFVAGDVGQIRGSFVHRNDHHEPRSPSVVKGDDARALLGTGRRYCGLISRAVDTPPVRLETRGSSRDTCMSLKSEYVCFAYRKFRRNILEVYIHMHSSLAKL